MKNPRLRLILAAVITATIALGLASRKYPALFPAIFEKYPGDALWAQMVYWLAAFVSPYVFSPPALTARMPASPVDSDVA